MRVCDPCFDLYGPKEEAGARPPAQQQKKKTEGDLPAEYLASALSKQVCTLIFHEKRTLCSLSVFLITHLFMV